MNITFLLPGNGRSGGVRVTVEMANQLLLCGHNVRIGHFRNPVYTKTGLKRTLRCILWRLRNISETDWLNRFNGKNESFAKLEDLKFSGGEVVIAVGSVLVNELFDLDKDIYKVRYCHGLSGHKSELKHSAWSLPMPTISVSEPLVPVIEELSGEKVLGIVPNGINPAEYFIESGIKRDGIGTIFSNSYEKAPEDTLKLLDCVARRWPHLRQYVFGKECEPKGLNKVSYWRYPSIAKVHELYNCSKIWLVPSRSEGFGLPILEAMACGSVVISTDTLGASELISHGKNGFVVPFGDTEDFMHYIELILRDNKLCRCLVEQGLETVAKYTWSNATGRMLVCLNKLLEGHS